MLAESLPGKLYHFWLHSAIFALLQRIYGAVRHVYLHSCTHALLTHESAVQRAYASSLFARLIRGLFGWIVKLCGRILDFFGRVNAGSVNHKLWLRFGRTSRFLRYDFLFGAFLCCMFLCPHDFWSNTYALLAAAGFLVLLFFAAARKRQALPDFTLLSLPFFLFACACVLSLSFTRDLADSVRVLMFYLTAFLLCFLAAGAAADRKTLMTVLGFLYAAVVLTAVYAFVQRIMGVEVSSSYTDLSINTGVPGRVYSTLDNPNNYAEFLVLMTPLAAAWAINVKAKLGNLPLSFPLICGLVLPLGAILMTYSRSGWIALALAALVFVYFTDKKLIPVLFLLGVLCIPFLPDSVITRFLTLFNSADSSNNHRIHVWQGVLLLLRDNWSTGIGLGPNSFAEVYPLYARRLAMDGAPHSHMVYMELIVETGAFGFLSFMWFYLRTIRRAGARLAKRLDPFLRFALIGCLAALVGIAFSCLVEYVWYYPRVQFAFFLVCGFCCGLCASREAFLRLPDPAPVRK